MKVFIHTDLEGVSGIDNLAMIQQDNPRYDEARLRLTEDINAAVAGAFDGGATHVMVLDSHGGGTAGNVIWEKVDKRAEREPRPAERWWGHLDGSYAATFFIGAHAMAGTMNAFLDHTQSSQSWFDYYVNGRKMGEMAQWALVAGHFGVPFVMMAGDQAAATEAYEFFSPVETAVVKRGVGRLSAALVDLEEAHRRIYDAAKRSLKHVGKARPFTAAHPIEVILDFMRTEFADEAAKSAGIERIGGRRIRKIARNQLEILP
jgi:D-amino peptidase